VAEFVLSGRLPVRSRVEWRESSGINVTPPRLLAHEGATFMDPKLQGTLALGGK